MTPSRYIALDELKISIFNIIKREKIWRGKKMKETERAMRKWKRQNEERVAASKIERNKNRERKIEDKFEIER